MRQGFASPYWLTFKQALELGGNVRKGSKGTTIVYANKLVVKDSETDNERSEEHTSELQSLMRISYAVFCLKKKKQNTNTNTTNTNNTKTTNTTNQTDT